MPKISPKHALTDDELSFCRIFVAFKESNAAEAYRRAFFPTTKDKDGHTVLHPDLPVAKECGQLASRLLKQTHISDYITEIKAPTGDHARQALAEETLFSRTPLKAATAVLEQEDKLGFRSAQEKWAEVMCDIGATVVVPIPHACVNCGHPVEITVPLAKFFPQFSEEKPSDPA